ncbi:MAG: tRNA lysidine(34) synthetase TilS [Clostridia bacterium]|nr:tRNA lysidine(34) synthetase TilS [Clostridia bacterium]
MSNQKEHSGKRNFSITEKVKQTIEKYHLLEASDQILVGVSGGPDSITLLNILYELGYNIIVAHVNHGIRENAEKDEKFVENFCLEKEIPCFIKRVKLKEIISEMTLEELGRKIRYDFFYEIMQQENCTKIATAHNANDNAETVIMNMIRGSGMSGLKGIGEKREDGIIIRPLIEIPRQAIEEYCIEKNLNPCHDESNDETVYTRNKIRLELIPYIEKNINSNVISNINRMSGIISLEEEFIQKIVNQNYKDCVIAEEDGRVLCDLKKFNSLDNVIKRRLIIKFIIKTLGNAKDIERVHIEDILKLCENNVGGKYLTPNKNIKVSVMKGKVEYLFCGESVKSSMKKEDNH